MSDGCSLALKINVTFCERVKDEGEGSTFRRLSGGQAGGEGHPHWKVTSDTVHAYDFVAQLSKQMLWKVCQARDALGFWCLRFFLVFDIPDHLPSKPGGADQDEMLPRNKPKAEFLPVAVLLTPSELHQGKCCPWCLDVAKGLLPRPVEVWIIQRATCCTWFLIVEETNVVSVSLLTKSYC